MPHGLGITNVILGNMKMEKLGKYCKIISGYAFKSNDLSEGTEIPVIKIGNISNGDDVITDSSTQYVSSDFLSIDEKYHIKKGDVLISLTGSHINQPNSMVGRSCRNFSDTEFLLNQRAGKVIPNENADKNYLYYLLNTESFKYSICNRAYGAANQANVSPSDIENIKWNFPPLPTQQKIASILSAYDNLIQNYKKQIEALQTAASELYKEWFVRFRFPGYQTTNFENGIPEGWKVYRIKDLCYINKKTVSSKDAKKEILYLDTGSITENVIDSFESYILEEAPSRARRIVKKNSIIFSTVRPNQNHYGILKTVPENLIVSTGFAVFDPKFDIANILYFFLSSKDFVDYCQMIAEGAVATYPSIKPEEIGKVKILLPTMDLAIKLNHSFESLFLRIENLKQQITNLTQQRDLLLPRLMSGKLEV